MRNSTGSVPKWPGWETIRMIGRGNYGAVYEIQRNNFGMVEKAALKRIAIPQEEGDLEEYYNNGYDEDSLTEVFQSHLESVVAEYSLMRKMNGCVNIVNCDDILYEKQEDGIGWNILIRMELLTPITKALTDAVTEEMVCKVARDMCTALTHCKEFGIVHRDIKPQNIFVSRFGDYKLGDFGIAKTVEKTMGGTKIGTYNYMAPEVYMNQPYGAAVDIYSLGLVLYWMLNEKRMPFMPLPPEKLRAGMDEQSRMRRLSGEPLPPPAHGSEKLKQIVLKACAFDPKERYQTAAEMLADLNAGEAAAIPEPPKPPVEYHPAPVEAPKPEPQPEPEDAGDKTSYLWAKEQTEKASDRTVLITPEEKLKKLNSFEMEVAPKTTMAEVNQVHSLQKQQLDYDTDEKKAYLLGQERTAVSLVTPANTKNESVDLASNPVSSNGEKQVDTPTKQSVQENSIRGPMTSVSEKTVEKNKPKDISTKAKVKKGYQWKKCTFGGIGIICLTVVALLALNAIWGYVVDCANSPIKILKQPPNVVAANGEIVTLSVKAVGVDLTYQWYISRESVDFRQSYANSENYTFTMMRGRNGWTYYCVITDKYGNSVQTDTVTVRLKSETTEKQSDTE